ncbi:MAG: hypothetical protein Q6K70_07745, partial [Thermostichales cyanobacterium DRC_bins_46]
MQGSVAQMIALTVWGNGALQGRSGYDEAGFYPENPAFRCCEYVRFGDPDHETASDPVGWLGWLRGEGVQGLQMIYGGLEKAEDNQTASGGWPQGSNAHGSRGGERTPDR